MDLFDSGCLDLGGSLNLGGSFWIVEDQEVLDFVDVFRLGGSLFWLEIFAGSVSLSFLICSQVGVLDLVM